MGSRGKRVGGWLTVAIFCGAWGGMVMLAQSPLRDSGGRARLVVWVVHPDDGAAPGYGSAERSAPGYNEQTAGSFGDAAANFGTVASKVGAPSDTPVISREAAVRRAQAAHDRGAPVASATVRQSTAGDFGQTASSVGTAASNHGTSVSNLGTSAGDTGTAAGDYGQAPDSLGPSSHLFANAVPPPTVEPAGGLVELAARKFMVTHRAVRVQFVAVAIDNIEKQLKAKADSRSEYPDVLVFEDFPRSWAGLPVDLEEAAGIHVEAHPLSGWGAGSLPGALSGRLSVVLPRGRNRADAEAFEDFLRREGALAAQVKPR